MKGKGKRVSNKMFIALGMGRRVVKPLHLGNFSGHNSEHAHGSPLLIRQLFVIKRECVTTDCKSPDSKINTNHGRHGT